MSLFQEYLNAKSKMVKPVIDISGGKPTPEKPPTSHPENKSPYVAKSSKSEKGFGDQGDKDLEYEPGKHKTAKIPTVEQVEFSSLIAEAVKKDQTIIENIIRQLKANGLMGPLVAEMLQHKETYKHISEVMGHKNYGLETCKNMVKAMKEEVASPFHASMDLNDNPDNYNTNSDTSDEEGVEDLGEPCNACNPDGSGENIDPNCVECGGSGFVPSEDVDIDVDMEDDMENGGNDPLMQMNPAMANFQHAMNRF